MGKVKKIRKKYNLACQKSATATQTSDISVAPVVKSIPGQDELPVKLSNDGNIFAGFNISFSGLAKTLLPSTSKSQNVPLGTVSEPSVVESTLRKGLKTISKKSKIIAKREALLKKIDIGQAGNARLRKKVREKVKLAKKPEVPKAMLMTDLISALPMLPSSDKSESGSNKEKKVPKSKPCLSKKKRNKQFMDGMKAYKAVLGNACYKADPASAITNYIINTASRNNM